MLVRTDLLPDSAPQVHWRIPDPPALRYRRDAEYVEHYRHLLDAAVRDRLHPDGTAILLSGGLDSTSLAATARRVAPGTPLFALTTRTREVESGEESRLAATVARRLGLAHELRDVSLPDPDVVARHTPEPYDDPGYSISCEVAAALAVHAPVVIEGEDGDALFAPPSLRAMARQWPVADIAVRFVQHTIRTGHHPYVGTWLAERLGLQRPPERAARPAWLSPAAQLAATATEAIMPFHSARPDAARRLTGSIWQGVHDGCDRAFHGVALEYRWPLLDARLMEFVFAIPPIPWCQRKFLVRQAFAGELPAEVIRRRKETVAGSHKRAVRSWRERSGAPTPALHQHTAEFVDAARLGATLRKGGTEDVMAAWRALALDRWLRGLDAS
jgi:asparagine synthase (glutamine-hydrolysing)